jgi:hypothetical protein
MLSVISLLLVCIILGQGICLYKIHRIEKSLQGLLNENDAKEMVLDYSLLLDDRLIQFNSDLQHQIDQIGQRKRASDEDKWDAYRKAFTPPKILTGAIRE